MVTEGGLCPAQPSAARDGFRAGALAGKRDRVVGNHFRLRRRRQALPSNHFSLPASTIELPPNRCGLASRRFQ